MYAIIKISGRQYKVSEGQEVFLNRLQGNEGDKVTFEEVLLKDKDGKVEIGSPTLKGSKVSAKIVEHLKGDKVLVFKKKRRKGYKKKNGHRQYLTKVLIEGIK
jgi:large subunit ribosomal protein L21